MGHASVMVEVYFYGKSGTCSSIRNSILNVLSIPDLCTDQDFVPYLCAKEPGPACILVLYIHYLRNAFVHVS